MNQEQRLIQEIEQAGGKVKIKHIRQPDFQTEGIVRGGTITYCFITINNTQYIGDAIKHPKDQFSKATGRIKALGRAYSAAGLQFKDQHWKKYWDGEHHKG